MKTIVRSLIGIALCAVLLPSSSLAEMFVPSLSVTRPAKTAESVAGGAVVGGALGAIVGHQSGSTKEGALIGAAAGALFGRLANPPAPRVTAMSVRSVAPASYQPAPAYDASVAIRSQLEEVRRRRAQAEAVANSAIELVRSLSEEERRLTEQLWR